MRLEQLAELGDVGIAEVLEIGLATQLRVGPDAEHVDGRIARRNVAVAVRHPDAPRSRAALGDQRTPDARAGVADDGSAPGVGADLGTGGRAAVAAPEIGAAERGSLQPGGRAGWLR